MSSYVFYKDPGELLDYVNDWEDWLGTDTILTSTWDIPTGVTYSTDTFTTTTATIWVSGGSSDTVYTLTNTITTVGGRTAVRYIVLIIKSSCNLNYLIPMVRLRIGDYNSNSYRYMDDWILKALVVSVSTLSRWMNFKYLLDDDDNVYRNPNTTFIFEEPPIIEMGDDGLIVLMAAYIILEGSLENSAWDYVSWRDNEIAFSNLESSRARDRTLSRLWDELMSALLPPTKRLAHAKKQTLPGYLGNEYEIGNMK